MKVVLLSILIAISTYSVSANKIGVLKLTDGIIVVPNGAVNNVDPSCNDPPELHLPHPSDCTKFYRCVANRKIWLSCPSTLYFNRVLEVCDWPGASGCTPGTTPPTQTTKPPTQTTSTKPPIEITTKPPTKPPTEPTKPPTETTKPPTVTTPKPTNPPTADCPAGVDNNFHANPNDCRKFWQCIEGIRNNYTCPSGLYFNPKTINCEPNNGQCDK